MINEKRMVAVPLNFPLKFLKFCAIEVEKKGKKEEEGTATEPSAESKS
ncbi:MAG: hypothetical protein AAB873_01810 [Patescibacteria group bacterium]